MGLPKASVAPLLEVSLGLLSLTSKPDTTGLKPYTLNPQVQALPKIIGCRYVDPMPNLEARTGPARENLNLGCSLVVTVLNN